jgi:hypothetical protein
MYMDIKNIFGDEIILIVKQNNTSKEREQQMFLHFVDSDCETATRKAARHRRGRDSDRGLVTRRRIIVGPESVTSAAIVETLTRETAPLHCHDVL